MVFVVNLMELKALIRLTLKLILSMSLSLSALVYGVENDVEKYQLVQINNKYIEKFYEAKHIFEERLQEIRSSSIEGKIEFNEMLSAWVVLVEKKCAYESNESKGTDAELAMLLSCKVNEYNEMNKYLLESVINMP